MIIALICVASVVAYLASGWRIARWQARTSWTHSAGDLESIRRDCALFAYWLGWLFWPLTIWWFVGKVISRGRGGIGVLESCVPELRQRAIERRNRELQNERRTLEADIARLHRELGIK